MTGKAQTPGKPNGSFPTGQPLRDRRGEGADEGIRNNFRTWFKDPFWKHTGYRDAHHQGERVLVKFLPNNKSVTGAIEPVMQCRRTIM